MYADDVVNAGFVQGDDSHVAVQVVYDELAVLDDYDGVDITRLTRELQPVNPLALNLMRITVDGKPIDDPKRSSSDIQRCTDVAMAGADIQFGFDNLRSAPRLNVTAMPARIAPRSASGRTGPLPLRRRPGQLPDVHELLEFHRPRGSAGLPTGQSLESEPLEVIDIALDEHGSPVAAAASWTARR